ncbi:MAG TPA: sigma-70 family RNA polymerase sigma factor [Thermoanaerobaculia bacterium]|nr:sigma-70 family RNA polymerase sigma factor [Thermoanaerobaculia bacterium]
MEFFPFDAEYVERLRAGDAAVEAHFDEYFRKLLLIKLRRAGASPSLIADATQETLYRVLDIVRTPGGIHEPERLGAFVNSVCNNYLHEHHRKHSRFDALSDKVIETAPSKDDPEHDFATKETCAAVRAVLDRMPEKDAQLLRAVFVDERDKDDVCAELGIDRDYLRVLLHRALKQFKKRYRPDDPPPSPTSPSSSPPRPSSPPPARDACCREVRK